MKPREREGDAASWSRAWHGVESEIERGERLAGGPLLIRPSGRPAAEGGRGGGYAYVVVVINAPTHTHTYTYTCANGEGGTRRLRATDGGGKEVEWSSGVNTIRLSPDLELGFVLLLSLPPIRLAFYVLLSRFVLAPPPAFSPNGLSVAFGAFPSPP